MIKVIFSALILVSAVWGAPLSQDYIDKPIELPFFDASFTGLPNHDVGDLVAKWNLSSRVNPEELGTYYQGDMLDPRNPNGRSAQSNTATRWKNGVVPYVITGSFSTNQMNMINSAFAKYAELTCIRWVKRTNEVNYVDITGQTSGCWSNVGMINNGRQVINLQPNGCLSKIGTSLHEMMHTLGFHHEQSRSDRNNFVQINADNIDPNKIGNFNLDNPLTTTSFGTIYDFNSVMHYSANAFSKNSRSTIVTLEGQSIGQRDGLSQLDLAKIKFAYNCPT